MTQQRYGWYSAEAAKKYGYVVYRSMDGTDILVTNVNYSATDPEGYMWSDAVCVGPVGEFIKSNSKSIELIDEDYSVRKVLGGEQINWYQRIIKKSTARGSLI